LTQPQRPRRHYICIFIYTFLLGTALALTFPAAVLAVVDFQCNLAPNPAFENLSSGMPANWALAVFSGSGSASLSTYPSPVQSGNYAVKVTTTSAGDVEWRTPEPGTISVLGSTSYTLAARLKAGASNQQAGFRVIQWTLAGAFVADTWLSNSATTADWQTLESSFTTAATTRRISIRLMHHISAGTFIWDDIRLWKTVAGERCFDARHFVAQTSPGERHCWPATANSKICIDWYKAANGELVQNSSQGGASYWNHTGDGSPAAARWIAPLKDHGATGQWTCFADVGEDCGIADGTNVGSSPASMPLEASLPVLSTTLSPSSRTSGGVLLQDWQEFDLRGIDPVTGAQFHSGHSFTHRIWGFFLSSIDLQGTLGTKSNVAVFEHESNVDVDPTGFNGGQRLERYYFLPGVGMVRATGRQDSICNPNPTPANCAGNNYDIDYGGDAYFTTRESGDFRYEVNIPWQLNNWWND
jgi:hypothetical protein